MFSLLENRKLYLLSALCLRICAFLHSTMKKSSAVQRHVVVYLYFSLISFTEFDSQYSYMHILVLLFRVSGLLPCQ